MSIPISSIIKINPSVIGTGSNPLALNGLILTSAKNAPMGEVLITNSAEEVQEYFGGGSAEHKCAQVYFSGFDIAQATPDALLFCRYAGSPVGAWAYGSSLAGVTTNDLSNVVGSVSVTIDGTTFSASSLDLSTVTSFTDMANKLSTSMKLTGGASILWNSVNSRFEITSGTTGKTSTITQPTGTACEALGLSVCQLSQGAEITTPVQAVQTASEKNLNWATFTMLYDTAMDVDAVMALAKWQADKNSRYLFIPYDTDKGAVIKGSTTCLGAKLYSLKYNVMPVYNTAEVACFAMGCFASVSWDQLNGRITLSFKKQEGLAPTVNDKQDAEALLANGYSYYGAYASDGPKNTYNFFYNGQLTGSWKWSDSYVNQIFLNAQLRNALIDMLLGVNSMPYSDLGYNMIRSACQDPIDQGVKNGSITQGVTMSNAQRKQVFAKVGIDITNELHNQGYYLQISEATAQTRGQRISPPINFFYTDGGSIQQITVPSIAVQ